MRLQALAPIALLLAALPALAATPATPPPALTQAVQPSVAWLAPLPPDAQVGDLAAGFLQHAVAGCRVPLRGRAVAQVDVGAAIGGPEEDDNTQRRQTGSRCARR